MSGPHPKREPQSQFSARVSPERTAGQPHVVWQDIVTMARSSR
jgi:hypothetical protein